VGEPDKPQKETADLASESQEIESKRGKKDPDNHEERKDGAGNESDGADQD